MDRIAAAAALVVSSLFVLLYLYQRRAYIAHWGAAWVLLGIGLAAESAAGLRAGGRLQAGIEPLAWFAAAVLMVESVPRIAGPGRFGRSARVALAVALVWWLVAPLLVPARAQTLAWFAAITVALILVGLGFARLFVRRRLLGAGLLAGAAGLMAAGFLWTLIVRLRIGGSWVIGAPVLVMDTLLGLFTALGMQVLVFEEVTTELRAANSDLEQAHAHLERLVMLDPLTGVYNRRSFEEVARRELTRHRRAGTPLSLLFLDVNNFKTLNDKYGHEIGDRVLQGVATLLRRSLRETDYVFRWGGDEFVVLIACSLEQAEHKAGDIKRACRLTRMVEGPDLAVGVSLSVGCVEVPRTLTDLEEICRTADRRMYEDKRAISV